MRRGPVRGQGVGRMPERFVPSRNGFVFANAWPSQPAVALPTPFGTISVGDAAAGLCGGMTFAALDYWQAGVVAPSDRPGTDDPLYGFIVHRLVDSWHVPAGVAQYYQWMNLPDGDHGFEAFGRRVVIERGLAWRTVTVQWPQVSADLDHGIPVALGVVTVASAKPRDLALNHQVLAVNYHRTDDIVTMLVYDPNQGRRDDIYIRFQADAPTRPTVFEHNLGIEHPVRGFFRASYAGSVPTAP
jgi:hypothetical protein